MLPWQSWTMYLNAFTTAPSNISQLQVIRLTGDCPLADPTLIDRVIAHHLQNGNDYTTNAYPQTYPDGLDVEVMTFATLQQVYNQATEAAHKEHVTSFIRDHAEQFKLGEVLCDQDLSAQRWTVDYPEDFVLVEKVFEALYPNDPAFDYQAVLHWLEQHPQVTALNKKFVP